MLPHKHFAAEEIEQVLQNQEDPTTTPFHECDAEESTLRRWKQEFPQTLTVLASRLESLASIAASLVRGLRPLQRIYKALSSLVNPPPDASRLSWAFFLGQSHPVHLG
jgi:hypothetical protein